mmetsp:Transcript_61450/g.102275  ORF Transcript_61450/g.102275 Transcript_61450/m.102275 type:complete len:566 (-) Transcript_61450:143-1840(-)
MHQVRRTQDDDDEEIHEVLGVDLVVLSFFLVVLIAVSVSAEARHIPSSAASIVLGSLLGIAAHLVGADRLATFDEELFLYLLLPPVIFEAGFSLSARSFFSNLATILTFAIPGTMLSTFVIGCTVYTAGRAGWFGDGSGGDVLDFDSPLEPFIFGALVSATDPVATLSIMQSTNADPTLYHIIFGESVLNDAVAIVMVRILTKLGTDGFRHPIHFLGGVVQFLLVSIGSVGIGSISSAASAALLKLVDTSHHPAYELSLLSLFGYCSYCAAEATDCSGIVALFITGVLVGRYHVFAVSDAARAAAPLAFKALAHLAESAVFAYMGANLFVTTSRRRATDADADADADTHNGADIDPASSAAAGVSHSLTFFVVFCVTVVLLARVVVVLPLCAVANLWRSEPISARMSCAMIFAGLRGAIAFALASNVRSEHRQAIVAATVGTVIFTTFVLGSVTRPLLQMLHLTVSSSPNVPTATLPAAKGPPAQLLGQGLSTSRMTARVSACFETLDEELLKPVFGSAVPSRRETRRANTDGEPDSMSEMMPLSPAVVPVAPPDPAPTPGFVTT